jgi:SET domain-containing protein
VIGENIKLSHSTRHAGNKEKDLEKKLKPEYLNFVNSKKKHLSVYVAPSKIHKYGLFARTSYYK